jgi:predicted phosphodiesterase
MIVAVGDTHFPFEHKKATAWAIKLINDLKPDMVIQMGDLLDQFSFSRYPKSRKMDPDEELRLGRKGAEAFWKAIKVDCDRFQLQGNHDDRMIKAALKSAPELMGIVGEGLDKLYKFEGVETIKEYEFEYDGIMFQHGHRAKLGDHAKYNQCSTVVGHSHAGGVVYLRNRAGVYFELNAGFLGDIDTAAFTYLSQKKVNTTTLGVGIIDEYGPRFVPYPGDK